MKTLKEQISDILNERSSKQSKHVSLVKLGLRPYEISLLLGNIKIEKVNPKFNANTLTFGVEIECYNVIRASLITEVERRNVAIQSQSYNHNDSKTYFKIVSDASISGNDGQEVVSPILKGKKG